MDLGWGEILLIGFVALLVYGGRLPEVARSVGRSVAALKRGLRETTETVTRDLDPGLDDAFHDRPRRTVRAQGVPPISHGVPPIAQGVPPIDRPAPADLATEDVSSPAPAPPSPAQPGADGPPSR